MLGLSLTMQAQQKVYTLADWNLKDWDAGKGELALDVSEYKLDDRSEETQSHIRGQPADNPGRTP